MQYDSRSIPNAFLSLYTTESACHDIINACPVRYRLISVDATDEEFPPAIDFTGEDANKIAPVQEEKIFELNASTTTFDHISYLTAPRTNPLHEYYTPVATNESYIAASLAQNIPKSLWSKGLQDWETARKPVEGKVRDDGVFKADFSGKRKTKEHEPKVMLGLKGLIEARQVKERTEAEAQRIEIEEQERKDIGSTQRRLQEALGPAVRGTLAAAKPPNMEGLEPWLEPDEIKERPTRYLVDEVDEERPSNDSPH